jgi:hypothetical protein
MTGSIFNFTTGHPELDGWLKGRRVISSPTISAPANGTPRSQNRQADPTRTAGVENDTTTTPAREISSSYWQGHNGRGLNRSGASRG